MAAGVSSMGRWIGACAAGEALALVASALFSTVTSLAPTEGLGSYALPVLLVGAGVLEGAIVGWAQASVLDVPRARWAGVTALAFGGLWAIGACLSLIEPATPTRAEVLAFSALTGAGLGVLVGTLQGRVRRLSQHLPRNALGWALALIVTAIGADLVPHGDLG
ncbi:MAG: hypothetical protein AAF411_26520, partial [Myxococcota bacterium]